MPRDYKNSTQRKKSKKPGLDWWDGLLIAGFIVIASLFGLSFLNPVTPKATTGKLGNLLSTNNISEPQSPELAARKQLANKSIRALAAKAQAKVEKKVEVPAKQDKKPEEPRFDFYTILPSLEVIVPEHEIKTRIREEQIGIASNDGKYIMQAGSFREFGEAKRLKDRLVSMGVESRIERAQVGEAVWNRIKIGPYSGMNTVMAIKTRLRNSGIDALVLEFKEG